MSDSQTNKLSSLDRTDEAATTDGSVPYETMVQTLDEYATLLNCLLTALNASRPEPDQASPAARAAH